MKTLTTHFRLWVASLMMLCLGVTTLQAATIVWTNTTSGSFGTAADWSPNAVPGSGDLAVITNTGTYTVTLDTGRTVGGMQLGVSSGGGTQTFSMNANALTLNGSTIINTNGLFIVSAALSASGINMTNNGTVTWTGGAISQGNGAIYNNGLWDAQGDSSLNWDGNGSATAPAFNNAGTFRKSAGGGTTLFNAGFAFNNTGTNDVQTGTVSLAGGGVNSAPGVFNTASGTALLFNSSYTFNSGSQFSGLGDMRLVTGTFTLNGNITFTKLTQMGGALAGTQVLNGIFTIGGGSWNSGGATTFANGSTLNITNNINLSNRILTNNGTVMWTAGAISQGNGAIYNNGLWDAQGNNSLNWDGNGSAAAPAFNNAGTFRKSAGGGTTAFNAGFAFNNTGTLDVQSGTVSLSGPHILTGGTLNIGISSLSSFGKVILSGASGFTGNFSANLNGGYIPITNNTFAVITYGSLSGTFGNYNLPFADAWTNIYSPTTFSLYVFNARPIPPVITNQIVNELVQLTVTNTAIDLDVPTNTLTYTLLDPPTGAGINSSGIFTWTPDETQGPGTNVITTVVIDNGTPILKATNSFTVVINEINLPPVLSAVDTNIIELTTLTVTNTAVDTDIPVNSLTYVLIESPEGATIDTNGVITWTPAEAQGPNTNTFTTVVTDTNIWAVNTKSFSVTNTFQVVVNESNVAPALFLPVSANIDELVAYSAQATAIDTDIPVNGETFALLSGPAGLTVSPGGAINWTPDESQGYTTNTVVIMVTDSNPWAINPQHLSTTNSYQLVVNEINVPPVLPPIADTNVNELVTVTITNTATDSDLPLNPLAYVLLASPSGATIGTNGVITWTPTEAQGPSTNIFTTVVTDTNIFAVNSKSLSATNTFSIVVNELNVAPVLTLPADTNINELVAYTVFATATDADIPTNALTFALVSGPTGLTVSTNGAIHWTPDEAQGPSTNTVLISVTDANAAAINAKSLSVTNSFQIVVNEVNTAPIFDYFNPNKIPPNPTIDELQLYTFTLIGDDSDVPTNQLTYELVSGPTGLTVATNGALNWTPSEAQGVGSGTNYNIQVRVIDYSPLAVNSTSLSNQIGFDLRVREVNSAPVLPIQTNRTILELTAFIVTNTAADSDIPMNTLTYSLVSPPGGAVIDTNGVITWTPTEAQGPSTNTFTTIVADNGTPNLSATNSFTVVVNEVNVAPVLNAITNQTVNPGQIISFIAIATDADLPTNTLSFTLISPPLGATISSSSGLFNWRPAATLSGTTNQLQVQVTDNGTPNLSDTKSFTVIVNPIALVVLTPLTFTNSHFIFSVNGSTGPDYIIMASTNFGTWSDVATNLAPILPFQFGDTNAAVFPYKYYRVRLAP